MRLSIGRIEVARCDIFQRDDVVNWKHCRETCQEVADFCGPMQLLHETGLYLLKEATETHPTVLVQMVRRQSVWSIDQWWTLAQASCCCHARASCQELRKRAPFISETTSHRLISRPLLRKSNTMPHIGAHVCGLHVFCKVGRNRLCVLRIVPFSLAKFDPLEFFHVLRHSDGGNEGCWKRTWALTDVFQNRESS